VKWIAAVVAIAACQQGSERAPAALTPPRHPDAIGAATRCHRALASARQIEPAEVQRAITSACAEIFVERRCRDAWADQSGPATQKLPRILAECVAAYCPLLPAPQPARCTDASADPRPLWAAIHRFDLGTDAAAILDDPAPPPARTPPRADDVTWRVPIVTITKDAITLDWRPPRGDDERALSLPIARWDCAELKEQLALEVTRTWPETVRPTRSKQLLLAADRDAPVPIVSQVTDCVQDRTGVRQLYPDVTLVPQ
jgi:hypothetical protein